VAPLPPLYPPVLCNRQRVDRVWISVYRQTAPLSTTSRTLLQSSSSCAHISRRAGVVVLSCVRHVDQPWHRTFVPPRPSLQITIAPDIASRLVSGVCWNAVVRLRTRANPQARDSVTQSLWSPCESRALDRLHTSTALTRASTTEGLEASSWQTKDNVAVDSRITDL